MPIVVSIPFTLRTRLPFATEFRNLTQRLHGILVGEWTAGERPFGRVELLTNFLGEPIEMNSTRVHIRAHLFGRLVFHPKLPNCAFVGFTRGGVGSIMQGIEMQSRWAALVCSGKRRLPPTKEMEVS